MTPESAAEATPAGISFSGGAKVTPPTAAGRSATPNVPLADRPLLRTPPLHHTVLPIRRTLSASTPAIAANVALMGHRIQPVSSLVLLMSIHAEPFHIRIRLVSVSQI